MQLSLKRDLEIGADPSPLLLWKTPREAKWWTKRQSKDKEHDPESDRHLEAEAKATSDNFHDNR